MLLERGTSPPIGTAGPKPKLLYVRRQGERHAKGATVTKFLVLYRSPVPAREQMANATPEQAQAGMEAWQAWAQKAGSSIADLGAPLAGDGDITGFSILEADSRPALDELLADHPHRHMPEAQIDVFEFLPLPGM
jgi:hypothetical protein